VSATGEPQAPLKGLSLALTAFALAMGTFMQVLDTTIANVSLPTIAGNLGASTDQSTWIITSFVVANGIGVPITGWLMSRYGVVRVFVLSMLGFTVTSLLCGIAWSLESLVFFRTLQGALSGPVIPGSQALLLAIFPRERRTTALAIGSITTLVAPICGPILGGYISDSWHWGWIFLINVPVGLVVTGLCWAGLRSRESAMRRLPIDMVGLGLLVIWAGALQVIRELTGGYAVPVDGCTTYAVCMAELAQFERDLHRHVHLENNVLFPRAVALEQPASAP